MDEIQFPKEIRKSCWKLLEHLGDYHKSGILVVTVDNLPPGLLNSETDDNIRICVVYGLIERCIERKDTRCGHHEWHRLYITQKGLDWLAVYLARAARECAGGDDKSNCREKTQEGNNKTPAPTKKASGSIVISAESKKCTGIIEAGGGMIFRKGVQAVPVPLPGQLLRILRLAFDKAVQNWKPAEDILEQIRETAELSGHKDDLVPISEKVNSQINKELRRNGIQIEISHDVIFEALNREEWNKKRNKEDMPRLRRSVRFADGCGLISKGKVPWKTTIPFRLPSEGDAGRFGSVSLSKFNLEKLDKIQKIG